MINYNDAEKALNFLKSTDVEAARLKTLWEGKESLRKTMLAAQYEKQSGSAADKLQAAMNSLEYSNYLEEIHKAAYDWEVMKNKRRSAELQIDMWRSVNSNQRKGNI